ncbi:MAG: nitroreductase [Oscillospiraceae bacterium]|jgi:nitroreductase|nr:nitroreductase [Oscillospiraceae bacterium]
MSNEVLRAISDRRSIRSYTPEQITQEQLDAILKAAVESPSARNSLPWHFSVTQNQEIIRDVNERACAALAKQGGFYGSVKDIFYNAPTVIFISTDKRANPWAMLDCGIAAQSIMLAAHSLGLGTVPLGLPASAWDGGANDAELNAKLGFPDGYEFALAIAVGHIGATKEPHPLKDGLYAIIK